jgi:hypothetical protein
MVPFLDFALVMTAAALIGALAVVVLAPPLFRVVVELCGTLTRARFWTTYLGMILVLVPLLAASWLTVRTAAGGSLTVHVEEAVYFALAALLAALLAIGFGIWNPSRKLLPQASAADAAPSAAAE